MAKDVKKSLTLSAAAAETIVDVAATLGASYLFLGPLKRNALINLVRHESTSGLVIFRKR